MRKEFRVRRAPLELRVHLESPELRVTPVPKAFRELLEQLDLKDLQVPPEPRVILAPKESRELLEQLDLKVRLEPPVLKVRRVPRASKVLLVRPALRGRLVQPVPKAILAFRVVLGPRAFRERPVSAQPALRVLRVSPALVFKAPLALDPPVWQDPPVLPGLKESRVQLVPKAFKEPQDRLVPLVLPDLRVSVVPLVLKVSKDRLDQQEFRVLPVLVLRDLQGQLVLRVPPDLQESKALLVQESKETPVLLVSRVLPDQ